MEWKNDQNWKQDPRLQGLQDALAKEPQSLGAQMALAAGEWLELQRYLEAKEHGQR